MREFSKPDFTQIIKQVWKLRVEILVNPSVKCNCQCVEVDETYAFSATYCKEFRYRILRRSDNRFFPK